MVTFLRGTFDPRLIRAAQLLGGYKQMEIDGHVVMSLFETEELDLTNPLHAMVLARMNNSTILDDGTLVYASTLELIEQVLAPEPTLATLPDVGRAMSTLDTPLISSTLLGPGNFLPGIPVEMFEPQSQDQIAEAILTMRAQEPAPIVLAAIAGSTAGGPADIEDRPVDATPDPLTLRRPTEIGFQIRARLCHAGRCRNRRPPDRGAACEWQLRGQKGALDRALQHLDGGSQCGAVLGVAHARMARPSGAHRRSHFQPRPRVYNRLGRIDGYVASIPRPGFWVALAAARRFLDKLEMTMAAGF